MDAIVHNPPESAYFDAVWAEEPVDFEPDYSTEPDVPDFSDDDIPEVVEDVTDVGDIPDYSRNNIVVHGENSRTFNAAADLAQRGFSVFPIHRTLPNGKCACGRPDCDDPKSLKPNKKPILKGWQQKATQDLDDIDIWFNVEYPEANIGILMGGEHVAVDIDGPTSLLDEPQKAIGNLPNSLTSLSGRGKHRICKKDPNIKIPNSSGIYPGIDIRGDGGYIVAPGSIHITGKVYEWEDPTMEIADLPETWIKHLTSKQSTSIITAIDGQKVPEGQRNAYLIKEAALLKKHHRYTGSALVEAVDLLNQQYCDPPVPKKELESWLKSTDKAIAANPIEDELLTISKIRTYKTQMDGAEFMNTEYLPPEWIIDDFLCPGLTIMSANEKTGKSLFSLHLIKAVLSGEEFIGKVKKRKVIYLALDDPAPRVQERFKELGIDVQPGDMQIYFSFQPFSDPTKNTRNDKDGCVILDREMEKVKPGLVIIDSFTKVYPDFSAAQSNNYHIESKHVTRLKHLAHKHNCAIVCLHHTTKGVHDNIWDDSIGSRGVNSEVDTMWRLTRDTKGTRLHIRGNYMADRVIELSANGLTFEYLGNASTVKFTKNHEKILDVLKYSEPLSLSDLSEVTEIKKTTCHYAVGKLVKDGLVRKDDEKYSLNEWPEG